MDFGQRLQVIQKVKTAFIAMSIAFDSDTGNNQQLYRNKPVTYCSYSLTMSGLVSVLLLPLLAGSRSFCDTLSFRPLY